MGLVLSTQWLLVLRFLNAGPFGVTEPVTGQDVGFFVFQLPFYRMVHAWLLGMLVFVASSTLAVYAVVVVYEHGGSLERTVFNMPRRIKAHLAALGVVMMVLVAANHFMDIFELVYSTRGAAYGASYADVHAQLPALWVMTATALLTAVLLVVTVFTRGFRPVLLGLALWLGSSVLVGLVYPNLIEGFEVKPNQLEKERPYIANSIALTRQAYGAGARAGAVLPGRGFGDAGRYPGQPADDQQHSALGPPTAARHARTRSRASAPTTDSRMSTSTATRSTAPTAR